MDFTRKSWEGISAEAKDFVAVLLNKDPSKRPTAKQVPHARFRSSDHTHSFTRTGGGQWCSVMPGLASKCSGARYACCGVMEDVCCEPMPG